ncbi:MAG: hypothetical protein NVSMB64_19300 [Candidatus Velthaea sp.]
MKVEEGTLRGSDNTTSADAEAELRAYFARKRSISVASSLFLLTVSAGLALRWPSLGLDLAAGGACGVANMLLVMRNNERLVDGRRSRGLYAASNMVRILAVGAIPVIAVIHGPWWAMGIYFAGFFTPLAWYAVELQRSYKRGT